ncbi:hypothetical protein ACIBHX_25930 [Nonomuraea sp. NPDC050536]|uniref:hypothetical protein n=1 Tax=Nonomuraea sp. NPDC050536 TaxID=3364366 RepID=UPI0037CC3E12
MSKRSRRRRALTSGAPSWKPGYGPGEPHGPDDDDLPGDPMGGDGGVREPRRPKPAPPSLSARAPLPGPPEAERILTGDETNATLVHP